MKKILLLLLYLFCFKFVEAQQLMRYSCDADRVKITEFEKKRTFDKQGIILSGKNYHPLLIAQYGLLAYYNFLETADSIYYKKVYNQIKYFKDSSKVNFLFDGKGIGLPYNFNFWDLRAPWYSGMTQGFAISFLLRYYKLTNDESILPVVEKIAYLLKTPQNEGGTLSKTKEGCTWIEEYPNSKRAPQVLNGFINGLIGLHEYSIFFPEDTIAKQIFTEAYECLKKSLEFYDTTSWSYYDRNKKQLSNRYLWYQIYEMKHLFDLFQEPLFDYQMRLWAVMLDNKQKTEKSNKDEFINRYNSNQVEKMNDSVYHIPLNTKEFLKMDSSQIFIANSKREFRRYYKGKTIRNVKNQSDYSYICFPKDLKDSVDYIEITFDIPDEILHDITAYKQFGNNPQKGDQVELKKYYDGNKLFLSFPKTNISDFYIKVKKEKNFDIMAVESNFFDTSGENLPYFAHFISEPVKLEAGAEYKIEILLYNAGEAVLFYKSASTNRNLTKTKWKAVNALTLDDYFSPTENGFYVFMVVYNYDNVLTFNGNLKVSCKTNKK